MALFDFLFGQTPPPSVTSTTTTQSGQPDWFQDILRAQMGKASEVAGQNYQPNPNQRVAGFTSPQQQAFDLTQQNVGAYQPAINTAKGALDTVAGGFDQTQFDRYMNPAIDGVVDRIADLGARNFNEKLLPSINDTFTSAGQFGSNRHAGIALQGARDVNESVLGQQSSALAQAFRDAMSGYQTGQGLQTSAANSLVNLGSNQQQLGLKDAAALEAVGSTQQAQQQRNLDVLNQDFVEQRDYPKEQLRFLNEIVRGLPAPTQGTTTTQTGPGPGGTSPLGQLAGVGTAVAGLSKAGVFRKGGAVESRRPTMNYAGGGAVKSSKEVMKLLEKFLMEGVYPEHPDTAKVIRNAAKRRERFLDATILDPEEGKLRKGRLDQLDPMQEKLFAREQIDKWLRMNPKYAKSGNLGDEIERILSEDYYNPPHQSRSELEQYFHRAPQRSIRNLLDHTQPPDRLMTNRWEKQKKQNSETDPYEKLFANGGSVPTPKGALEMSELPRKSVRNAAVRLAPPRRAMR